MGVRCFFGWCVILSGEKAGVSVDDAAGIAMRVSILACVLVQAVALRVYANDVGLDTILTCDSAVPNDFNYFCTHFGYASYVSYAQGNCQPGAKCWALGHADSHYNQEYDGCGGGCIHYAYIDCALITSSPSTSSPSTSSPSTSSPSRTPTSAAPTRFCNTLRRCYDCTRAGCKWGQSSTSMGCLPPSSCTAGPTCFDATSKCPEMRSASSFCLGYCGESGRIGCSCAANCKDTQSCCLDYNYSCPPPPAPV